MLHADLMCWHLSLHVVLRRWSVTLLGCHVSWQLQKLLMCLSCCLTSEVVEQHSADASRQAIRCVRDWGLEGFQ